MLKSADTVFIAFVALIVLSSDPSIKPVKMLKTIDCLPCYLVRTFKRQESRIECFLNFYLLHFRY